MGSFSVVRCPTCKAAFSDVVPPPDHLFVRTELPHHELYEVRGDHFTEEAARYLRIVRKVPLGGKKLLDVGCGVGFFLAVANDAGFEVRGLDVSAVAVEAANRRLKAPIAAVGLSLADAEGDDFDIITFWNSLEHMADPRQAVVEATARLKPGGVLAIEVPVDDALINRLHHLAFVATQGRLSLTHRLFSRTLEGHMCLFTQRSFELLAEQLGLDVVHIERANTNLDELMEKHDFGRLRSVAMKFTLRALMRAASLTHSENRFDIVLRKPACVP